MKNILIILLSIIPLWLNATTYYVAASGGSDSNAGTNIAAPWATLAKAFATPIAGDTVYLRGGTWSPTSMVEHYPNKYGGGIGHNGTHNAPVCFIAYPDDYLAGNPPILDCINFTSTSSSDSGLRLYGSTYIKIKGLTVKNCKEKVYNQYIAGVDLNSVGWIHLENMVSYGNGGYGFQWNGFDTLYVTNCDAYSNADIWSATPGNKADGFGGGSGGSDVDTFKIAYYYGCRAWKNSDDGLDHGSTKQFDISNCWIWNNGYLITGGDTITEGGVGLKIAPSNVRIPTKRAVHNCIISDDAGVIIQNLSQPYDGPVASIFNNFVYRSPVAYADMSEGWIPSDSTGRVTCRNNIGFAGTANNPGTIYEAWFKAWYYGYPYHVTQDHNVWKQRGVTETYYTIPNTDYSVTADDFVSLDTAQLRWARQADGSLPVITFGTLTETSDLINTGDSTGFAALGLTYIGTAPDLGYAEYNAEEEPPATAPLISTTAVTNITSKRATGGGNVTSDGGDAITERGVCWSTSTNPTTASSKVTSGTGEGSFTVNITGLLSNTTYHVRAYAINSIDTSYGSDVSFTTREWGPVKSGSVYVFSGGYIIKIE